MDIKPPAITSVRTPWGRIAKNELVQFSILAAVFFIIITSYWILKSLKDPVFSQLVGIIYQPGAKVLSMIFIFPLLLLYSKLVDHLRSDKLFVVFPIFYIASLLAVSFVVQGIDSASPSPSNLMGWFFYVTVESFGSLMVALFWGFTTGEASVEQGKKIYPMILFIGQLGAFIGPTVVTFSDQLSIFVILFATAIFLLFIPVIMTFYARFYTLNFEKQSLHKNDKKETGMFEGFRLIAKDRYVLGIMGIATLHEVVVTILDFQMKYIAASTFPSATDFAIFMGRFGQAVNLGTYLSILFGSSMFLRYLGMRVSLLLYPAVVLALVVFLFFNQTLWAFFGALVIFKILNYALNNPAKELLYTPTSSEVRFKAKSWIDAFGARGAKALGSFVTNSFRHSLQALSFYGSIFSLLTIGIWIGAALFVSKRFESLESIKK